MVPPRLLLCLLTLVGISAFSQPTVLIKRSTAPIVLDGQLTEPDWETAQVATQFRQFFPTDTILANAQTEIRLTYDDQFIYIAAKMFNLGPRKYVTPSLRRDFRGEANDGISIVLDTFKDKTNAFIFGVNPYGVQREGLVANGGGTGADDFSLNWDNKWYSEVSTHDDCWIAEIAIPFKTIRFKENLASWNVNFYRIDSQYGERSTWAPIPRNFDIVNLAFNKELIWDKPLRKPGTNVSLIPYSAVSSTRNFTDASPAETKLQVGGDAKIAIGPALNLDLTFNPDFSQVEVDEQVTNLDRFEIFFPERRQFFLENADLFANFGLEGTRPFFSRRIGVAVDASTGQNFQNTIYGGARLSGKINNNTRIGVLNMQAGEDAAINLPSTNYTVATLQQKVFARSNIGFILVNKQAFQDSIGGTFKVNPTTFSRTAGVDFNLASADNRWTGKAFYHRSFNEHKTDSAFSLGGFINFSTLKWDLSLLTRNVGAHYNPEVGFVRRQDIQQVASTNWYNMYPATGLVQSHGPGFEFDIVRNETHGFLDWEYNFMYQIRWRTTARFNIRLRQEYTYLFNPFDPSGTGGLQLPDNTAYRNVVMIANFLSDARKKFFYTISTRVGGYFNGSRENITSQLTYRYQPWGFTSLRFSYNHIRLPQPYNSADLILIGPRFDFTFTRNLFWTTFIQYNNQINNLNINSRFQWRFKPVSDLFVVYTDNYVADSGENGEVIRIGQPKNRALVLKLTYWLNL
ncbi:MAG: carbohydrate binding family 9 domain-containing protein [Cyclobacteriaceae bacterium]|nr:carbohydrate binding family 9 domain-containing protein [Cyclobacteriaceae bacterium]